MTLGIADSKLPLVPLKRCAAINRAMLGEDTDPALQFSYIDISSVNSEGHIHGATLHTFSTAPGRARRLVAVDDVLISTVRTYLRAITHIQETQGITVASTGFATLTANGSVDSRYLYWACRSTPFVEQVAAHSYGVAYPAIDPRTLGTLLLPLPSVKDQRRVASLLDRETEQLDELLRAKTRLIEALQTRRASSIFLGVCGLQTPGVANHDPGIQWTHSVRLPWPRVKIKYVAQLGTGHTPSRSHREYWEHCTIPWITTGEIQQVRDDRAEVITDTREKISEFGLANSAAEVHPKGTVVLCRTASAGYSAIMGSDMATSQDFVTWTCSDRLLPRYLLMCLRAMRPDLLGRLAYGSTHKTIYFPDIESLAIPLPSVAEQHEVLEQIDTQIKPLDELVDRLRRQIELIKERRAALITAAVTGQIDVSGAT